MGINNFAILKRIGIQAPLSKNYTSIIAFYWLVCWSKVMTAICMVLHVCLGNAATQMAALL